MAETYPRYRKAINRTRNHVLAQTRPPESKCRATLKFLSAEPATIEEIAQEVGLDHQSVLEALVSLQAKGEVAMCGPFGEPIVIRRDGKPVSKPYWRKGPPPPSQQP